MYLILMQTRKERAAYKKKYNATKEAKAARYARNKIWQNGPGAASEKARHAAYQKTPRAKVLQSLRDARNRCTNPDNKKHKYYGGKGILYLLDDCREEAIAKLLPGYTAIMEAGVVPSIDRINSKGHYSLDNIQALPLSINMAKH
jgi:hypothetical protein